MLHLFQEATSFAKPEFALKKVMTAVEDIEKDVPNAHIKFSVQAQFQKDGSVRFVSVVQLDSNYGYLMHHFMEKNICVTF